MNFTINSEKKPSYFEAVKYSDSEFLIRISKDFVLSPVEVSHLHYHNCIELGICRSGSGITYVDDRIYHFSAGDIQIVLPYQPHISKSDDHAVGVWDWISFDPYKLMLEAGFYEVDSVKNLIEKKISLTGLFKAEEYPEITRIIFQISSEAVSNSIYKLRKCALLVNLLLIELATQSSERPAYHPNFNVHLEKILPAIEKIDQHIFKFQPISSIKELSEKCNMNQTSFRKLFHELTGQTPKDYILNKRLLCAEYYLAHTQKSVLEISEMSGFDNISCFNRSFLKKNGLSPTAYRKKICE